MTPLVYILNGPNLNMLGIREPDIYGTTTLADIEAGCRELAAELAVGIEFRQTNHEGVMVDWLNEAYEKNAAVILNPAGFSFHSIPVLDALKILKTPYIELHISNIHARDADHQHSITAKVAKAVIAGLGASGYRHALRAMAEMVRTA